MPKIELSKVLVRRKNETNGDCGREFAMEITGDLPRDMKIAVLRDEK